MSAAVGLLGVLLIAPPARPAAQNAPPPIDDAMRRVTRYVVDFVSKFSNVTASEVYVQQRMSDHKTRTLKSDYLLASLHGSPNLLEFRDVYEVDGKPVGDRDQRLLNVLVSQPEQEWLPRAQALGREGSRYNLEEIGTLNKPLVAFSFLQAGFQPRFVFSLGPLDKKVAPDARLLLFKENQFPLLYRNTPFHGRVWIDDRTGAVLQTELLMGNVTFPDQIITKFAFDAAVGVNVPVEMNEWYSFGSFEVTGKATYGQFRRFGVSSSEQYR
jgi:hypothetical protein